MSLPENPISRNEHYLNRIATGEGDIPEYPISRIEKYLAYIAEHGGGGGGTTNYNQLSNKPKINSVELSGDLSSSDLGLIRFVTAESNTAVSGYQVPALNAEQVTEIYNAIVSGENVIVVDATEMMYFAGINADVISEEIFISFRYFDKMILEYDSEGNITGKSIDLSNYYTKTETEAAIASAIGDVIGGSY